MKQVLYIILCFLVNIGLYGKKVEKDPYVQFLKTADEYLDTLLAQVVACADGQRVRWGSAQGHPHAGRPAGASA